MNLVNFALCPFYAKLSRNITKKDNESSFSDWERKMKRKLFLLIFSIISLTGLVAWRTSLLSDCIDPLNGFFMPEYSILRIIFAIVLIIFVVAVAIIVLPDQKQPCSPRRSSKTLAVLNLVYGIVTLIQVFIFLNHTENKWDIIYLVGLLCLFAFMVYYAVCMFSFTKANPIISLIPVALFIFKLAHSFIDSFGIIKTSEVTLNILALVFCVLFFQFYARYISKVTFRKIRKPMMISGVCAVVFTTVAVLPDLIVPLFNSEISSRISASESFFMLSTAFYIFAFLIISFSKKLLYKIRSEEGEEIASELLYQ